MMISGLRMQVKMSQNRHGYLSPVGIGAMIEAVKVYKLRSRLVTIALEQDTVGARKLLVCSVAMVRSRALRRVAFVDVRDRNAHSCSMV